MRDERGGYRREEDIGKRGGAMRGGYRKEGGAMREGGLMREGI